MRPSSCGESGIFQLFIAGGLAVIVTGLIACDGDSPLADVEHPAHIASAACPLKTPRDWQEFLERVSDDEHWVKTCSDERNCGETLGAFASSVQTQVLDVLDSCGEDWTINPAILACTENLRRYVPTWMQQHGNSYGFRQDNHSYFAAQTAADEPQGMMEPPAALVAALSDRQRIEQVARSNGWPFLIHDSCLGGVRAFVVIPDALDRFDQWMLVGLGADESVQSPATVSFVAVQKKDAQGRRLAKVRLHFRDYLATTANGPWRLTLPEALDGKCYSCHVSGVRQLLTARGSITESAPVFGEARYGQADDPEFGMTRLASLNDRLASYGLNDWDGAIEPADHGPQLGSALGCTTCHNGTTRGPLTASTSEGTLRLKMIKQLSMRSPLGGHSVPDLDAIALLERDATGNPPLSTEEAAALERARAEHESDYQSFMAERFPAWHAWLLSTRCDQ
jgi:hypothetical protein